MITSGSTAVLPVQGAALGLHAGEVGQVPGGRPDRHPPDWNAGLQAVLGRNARRAPTGRVDRHPPSCRIARASRLPHAETRPPPGPDHQGEQQPGRLVLDAFCGCGTALVASELADRRWVGIDISPTACRVMAGRLVSFSPGCGGWSCRSGCAGRRTSGTAGPTRPATVRRKRH